MRSCGHPPVSLVLARVKFGFTFQEEGRSKCKVILGSHGQWNSMYDNVKGCIA